MPVQRERISISAQMVIEALTEQVERTHEAWLEYQRQLEERDEMIRDLKAIKLPERRIMAITGLSRDSIVRIVKTPPRPHVSRS